jgi:glycosyltransferase involved in cell wall biosynthesis
MKLLYATTYKAKDIKAWSGSVNYISQSLIAQGLELDYIEELTEKNANLYKVKKVLYKLFTGKNYLRDREPAILKSYSQQAMQKLKKLDGDIIFSPGTYVTSYLETPKPIVTWSDATFAGMVYFYPEFSNLCAETIKNGLSIEQSALDKCTLAIYSSDWAAQSAINNYKVDPNKIKVVPFGANVECNRTIQDIKTLTNSRSTSKYTILFLGVSWERKGGDIALKVVNKLHERGLNIELNLVGSIPDKSIKLPNYVNTLGFISKSTTEGKKKLDKLLAESHFLLLPSRAECGLKLFDNYLSPKDCLRLITAIDKS